MTAEEYIKKLKKHPMSDRALIEVLNDYSQELLKEIIGEIDQLDNSYYCDEVDEGNLIKKDEVLDLLTQKLNEK